MRAFLVGLLACPSVALACGGLFCSAGNGPPAPVDQAGEEIIFEVADGRVCAHVTIDYVGDADEFAWLVPVPDTPEVGETPPEVFIDLARQSNGTVRFPAPDFSDCPPREFGAETGGCGCSADGDDGLASADGDAGVGGEEVPPVQILGRTATENYDAVTLAAQSADDLVGWLQDNAYNVSDNMIPAMQPYLDEEMHFVAVRLRDGRSAERIRPLVMCYRAQAPVIPIRLTAVAAQPLMGIRVYILADHPYVPHEAQEIAIDPSQIGFDTGGNTGYRAWVARAVDEAEGRGLVAEFRGANPLNTSIVDWDGPPQPDCLDDSDCPGGQSCDIPQDQLVGFCRSSIVETPLGIPRYLPVLSRYYTRLSPHQMTFDPMFVAAPDAPAVDPDLDLSEHPSPQTCSGFYAERLANGCAFTYCGAGSECVIDGSGTAGCRCAAGTVAQRLTDDSGVERVTCVPPESEFGVLPEMFDANPCDALGCGAGTCSLRGGFRTCDCDEGAYAIAGRRGVVCRAYQGRAIAYGPGAGAESFPDEETLARFELRRAHPWVGGLLLLVVLLVGRRRLNR